MTLPLMLNLILAGVVTVTVIALLAHSIRLDRASN
jgi:hypothetical protein